MEIERKFTVRKLPDNLDSYPFHIIEQAYLNTDPVVRIRREDDAFYLTYKGKGMMAREEYNLPLNKDSYYHLLEKPTAISSPRSVTLSLLKIHSLPDKTPSRRRAIP